MRKLLLLAVLAFTGFAWSPHLSGQGMFPGAGMSDQQYGNGSSPFAQGRGMDHLVRQIEESEEPPGPMFQVPEWMKPKKPQWAQPKFPSPNSGGSSWFHLSRPAWLGGQKKPTYGTSQKSGFLSGAGKSFNQWRQNTGANIQATNENIRTSSSNAWQNMTRSFQRPSWMSPGSNETPPAIKPPLRTADNWSGRPTDRY